jgi:hypothetical protein
VNGVELKRFHGEVAGHFAAQMADVAVLVVIDIHLKSGTGISATKEDPGVWTPVGMHINLQFEVAEFLVAEKQTAVA